MRQKNTTIVSLFTLFYFVFFTIGRCEASGIDPVKADAAVENAIRPVMQEYGIPGMAVAVTVDGKHYAYYYGVASRETRQPVTEKTLFEIGSVSKTFTATLASYAATTGKLSLSDYAGQHLPELRGSHFDHISLLHLGAHTAGSLSLQVPEGIESIRQLMEFLKSWKSLYPPGSYRTYSNQSIGLLGMITAKSLRQTFPAAENELFAKLEMTNTYTTVPLQRQADYAQGYTKQDAPVRLHEGVLSAEAYGVKSSAADLLKFLDANMGIIPLAAKLQKAIDQTHTGYYQVGAITQDLIWEQYPYPVELRQLLQGNSPQMASQSMPATALTPPLAPQQKVWINKTGSTNGFGAYVAFIPEKKLGIVLLANKNYPIEARVTAAYQILHRFNLLRA